jgi:serine/threonine protein kinase, bacterial
MMPMWPLLGRHRRAAIALAAFVTLVLMVVTNAIGGCSSQPKSAPSSKTVYKPQIVLPFTGLNQPCAVAVDTAGDLYVIDSGNNRVLKLAAGSSTQTVLSFAGLRNPGDVAVDAAGDVYVTDSGNNRVVKLAAGLSTQTVLPFTGLNQPYAVAVDTAGDVYVTDWGNNRVLKLPAG